MIAMSLGSWFVWFFFLVIWVALAFWPARVAGRKGHSFFGFFILSLFFFPLALIVAYVAQDRRAVSQQEVQP
jgi:preprotein translocase subunit SecG